MRRVLFAWAMGVSTSVALALPAGIARACECGHQNPVQQLATAAVVVVGSVTDYADLTPDPRAEEPQLDRRWTFSVEQRFRGATADVIEVRLVEQSNCFAPDTIGPTLALGPPTSQGWYAISTCPMFPTAQELAYVFDEVPAGNGRGPPSLIAAAGTRDHTLVVLDGDGAALRYLPAQGPTRGLSVCPGSQSFVQLRGRDWAAGAALEVAVWSLVDWTEQRSVPVQGVVDDPFAYPPSILVCLDPDARRVRLADGDDVTVDTMSGAAEPTVEDGLLESVRSAMTEFESYGAQLMSSVSLTDSGRRVTGVFSNGSTGTTELGAEGTVSRSRLDSLVPIFPFVAAALDPTLAETIDLTPGDAPLPLLRRSGTRLEAPTPTLPAASTTSTTSTASITPASPTSPTTLHTTSKRAGDGRPWALLVGGGALLVIVTGWIGWRSRSRRRE